MRGRSTNKRWILAGEVPNEQIASLFDLDRLLVQVLWNRGITSPDEVREFLADEPSPASDPSYLKDLDLAVQRIIRAIERDETIVVYGDFDVDGITSLAVVVEVLTALGAKSVISYIPNRIEEGYGLNCQAIESLAKRGAKLIITVDCGVGAEKEVQLAHSLGIDVVITDHHVINNPIPGAIAVVNPRQPECRYPFKDLAGVGVAFKLAQGLLRSQLSMRDASYARLESSLLDLVALGTVADLAPLVGENRALVRQGIKVLNNTNRPGLQEMIRRAGLRPGTITSGTVSYIIGPRLNSAGRLADAQVSYRLLTTSSIGEARDIADKLESMNVERQRLTAETLVKARGQLAPSSEDTSVFVIVGEGFPPGIVGLVAGKLTEELHRPVLVLERGARESRGSARSIEEVDIMRALAGCEDLLVRFGGHSQAAGFTVLNSNLDRFRERLSDLVADQLNGADLRPRIQIDCELSGEDLTTDLYKKLVEKLMPFGLGNPNPIFLSRHLRVVERRLVGRDLPGHLRLKLTDGQRQWTAIGFNMGGDFDALPSCVDIVYSMQLNEWNGSESLDLHIKDWRPYADFSSRTNDQLV